MARTQAMTVVVVQNGTRASEPFLGRPPANDNCVVFGQHEAETDFLLDLRVRESLEILGRGGAELGNAILFYEAGCRDRDFIRRIQLLARKLDPGSRIVVAVERGASWETRQQICHLLSQAQKEIGADTVLQLWFESANAESEDAPLSAAWHRLQRFRNSRQRRRSQPAIAEGFALPLNQPTIDTPSTASIPLPVDAVATFIEDSAC